MSSILDQIKDVWAVLSTVGFLGGGLVYFKYVRAPLQNLESTLESKITKLNSTHELTYERLERVLNQESRRLSKLEDQLLHLESILDQSNHKRIEQAVVDQELLSKVQELRTLLRELEKTVVELRIELALIKKG